MVYEYLWPIANINWWFKNLRVTGSIPVSATIKIKLTAMWAFLWMLEDEAG